MNMFGLMVCIVFKNIVISITKKISNIKPVRLGVILLLISTLFLTFQKRFMDINIQFII